MRTAFLRHASTLLMLGLLGGCTEVPTDPADPTSAAQAGRPSFVISDGAHGGNPHVFFLPPMLPDPSAGFSAAFVGTLDVEIMICVWRTADKTCGPALEVYTRNAGAGSEIVRVPEGAEYYLVNWHTDAILDQFPLAEDEDYRIRVVVGKRVLAYADVQVVGAAKDLKNVNTGEYIPLLDGRTLPIKVRVEEGWEKYGAVETVEAGGSHTCRLTAAGAAFCWGDNSVGQLGIGYADYDGSTTPLPVVGGHTFVALSVGDSHTCALTATGAAYCWGKGAGGQLGGGTRPFTQAAPAPVIGGIAFEAISAGWSSSCGLTAGGSAYCWGIGNYGQLGDGNSYPGPTYGSATPVAVTGGLTFVALSVSQGEPNHTCALTVAGEAYCWGNGSFGQLGIGTTPFSQPSPSLVLGGVSFMALSSGLSHTCGLTPAGAAYCWGNGQFGRLGDGQMHPSAPYGTTTPVPVVGGLTFSALSAGPNSTCAIAVNGAVYCWGYGIYGQLGLGPSLANQSSPTAVSGGHTFTTISAGKDYNCGLASTDAAYCWGYGGFGQLGNGTWYPIYRSIPVEVVAPAGGW